MAVPLQIVDAFTVQPFAGNPAAVCLLERPADDAWMQNVAAEMNLAETAFLLRENDGYRLRWFTPMTEIDLCGHATLASAHTLWQTGRCRPDAAIGFQTRSGLLTAERRGEWIELDFPALPVAACEPPQEIAAMLGVVPRFVGSCKIGYLCELDSEEAVCRLTPDIARLATLGVLGTMVTARSKGGEFDFVSRFFAPAIGVPEDPVTGAAHCALATYWAEQLGRNELLGFQASRRGGTVRVRLDGERVRLGGQCITVLEGALRA